MDGGVPAFQKGPPARAGAPSKVAASPSSENPPDSASSARGQLQRENWKLSQELASLRKQLERERHQLSQAEDRHGAELRHMRARMRVLSQSTNLALQAVASAATQQGFGEKTAERWLQAARNGLHQDLTAAATCTEAKHLSSLLGGLPWIGQTAVGSIERAHVDLGEGAGAGESAEQVRLERDALAGFARQYQVQLQAKTASLEQVQRQLLAEQRQRREIQQALDAAKAGGLRERSWAREESSPGRRDRNSAAAQATAAVTEARVLELGGFLKKREKELEQERSRREEMARAHAVEMEKKQQEILELRTRVHELAMSAQAERVRLELWGDFGAQLARAVKALKQKAEMDLERLDARTLELERSMPVRSQVTREAVQRSERLMAELAVAQHRNDALLAANSSHEARFGALEDQTQQQLAVTKKLLLAETETRLALERRCRILSEQLGEQRQACDQEERTEARVEACRAPVLREHAGGMEDEETEEAEEQSPLEESEEQIPLQEHGFGHQAICGEREEEDGEHEGDHWRPEHEGE